MPGNEEDLSKKPEDMSHNAQTSLQNEEKG